MILLTFIDILHLVSQSRQQGFHPDRRKRYAEAGTRLDITLTDAVSSRPP